MHACDKKRWLMAKICNVHIQILNASVIKYKNVISQTFQGILSYIHVELKEKFQYIEEASKKNEQKIPDRSQQTLIKDVNRKETINQVHVHV